MTLEDIHLYKDDCLEVMKEIETKSVDLILCDLPYGTTNCKWDTIIDFEKLWLQYERIIKDDGAIVLFGSEPFSSELRISNLPLYKYDWVWIKNKCGNFMTAKYKPLKYTEDIMVFGKGAVNTKGGRGGGKTLRPFLKYNPQGVVHKEKQVVRGKELPTSGINRWNKLSNAEFTSKGSNYPKNYLYFDTVSNKNRCHPTEKPVELLQYLVETYSNEGDLVLDNCMGSGSAGVACINTNRKFIGIELNDTYYAIAEERIFQALENAETKSE